MKLSTLYTAFAGFVALHVVSAVTETQELRKTKVKMKTHSNTRTTTIPAATIIITTTATHHENHHRNKNYDACRQYQPQYSHYYITIHSKSFYQPAATANQQHPPQNLQGVQQPSVTWTRIVATLQQEKYNCTDNSRIVHKRRCLHQGLAFARTMVG